MKQTTTALNARPKSLYVPLVAIDSIELPLSPLWGAVLSKENIPGEKLINPRRKKKIGAYLSESVQLSI